jgi:hypothetical protein
MPRLSSSGKEPAASHISKAFSRTEQPVSVTPTQDFPPSLILNQGVFALDVTLLELYFNKPIEQIYFDTELNRSSNPTRITRLLAANSLVEDASLKRSSIRY